MSNSMYIRNLFADAYAAEALWVSFHSGDPGPTGANEIVAIPRVALTWSAAVDGTVTAATINPTFPADTAIVELGFWTLDTGGEFIDSTPYAGTFPAGGTDALDISYSHPE